MPLFDILGNDGLQRIGRLRDKKSLVKITTPSIVLPINEFLLAKKPYRRILEENKDLLPQVFETDIKLPKFLGDRHIIMSNGWNLDECIDERGKLILFEDGTKSDRIIQKISVEAPAAVISQEMLNHVRSLIQEDLNEELSVSKAKVSDFHFGIQWQFDRLASDRWNIQKLIEFVKTPHIKKHIKLIDLRGLFDNFMNFRDIVDCFLQLKSQIPSDIILMASGKIPLEYYSFLVYLGVDLIDACSLIIQAYSDIYLREDDSVWMRQINSADDVSCNCTFCSSIRAMIDQDARQDLADNESEVSDLIAFHNVLKSISEGRKIRRKIDSGVLRSYIETKSTGNTFLMSALRYCDSLEDNPFVKNQGLSKSNELVCATSLSYDEPQVKKFREKVKKNVFPSPDTKICVLLPCSMRKPYSTSKSHRGLLRTIRRSAKRNMHMISQAIVTSPLGLVPREIESVYPAAHYDISVTGEWDQEEINIAADMIAHWIEKMPENIKIIAHLYGGYLLSFEKFLAEFGADVEYAITGNYEELESAISDAIGETITSQKDESGQIIEKGLSKDEARVRMLAQYHFGRECGDRFISPHVRVLRGRHYDYERIFAYLESGKERLGRIDKTSGHIELSYEGASKISKFRTNFIDLNTNNLRGSTIFQPALKAIDEKLCAGDEVFIYDDDGRFIGVGEMLVNASTAVLLRHGPIVDIRKKRPRGK